LLSQSPDEGGDYTPVLIWISQPSLVLSQTMSTTKSESVQPKQHSRCQGGRSANAWCFIETSGS